MDGAVAHTQTRLEWRSVTCVIWNWNFEGFGEDASDKFLLRGK